MGTALSWVLVPLSRARPSLVFPVVLHQVLSTCWLIGLRPCPITSTRCMIDQPASLWGASVTLYFVRVDQGLAHNVQSKNLIN